MSLIQSILRGPRAPWPVYAAPIGLAAVLAALVGVQPWVTPDVLFRDPMSVAGGEPYFGLVSNLGILVWAAAASICLFAGFQLRRNGGDPLHAGFLLWSGVITATLLLDDLFLLHEVVYLSLFGLHETVLFAGYATLIAIYLVRYRNTITDFDPLLLGAALAMFAISIFFDKLTGPRAPGIIDAHPALHFIQPFVTWINPAATLLEDGPKLAGILVWATYLIRAAWQALCGTPQVGR